MKRIPIGASARLDADTDRGQTAAAAGNAGVAVVATTALILMLENAAFSAIAPYLETGEASVGTLVNVRHIAACIAGATVTATARVTAVDGRRVSFRVEARHADRLLMSGAHERVVVNLDDFLARQGPSPASKPA